MVLKSLHDFSQDPGGPARPLPGSPPEEGIPRHVREHVLQEPDEVLERAAAGVVVRACGERIRLVRLGGIPAINQPTNSKRLSMAGTTN